jgi:hydrogenase-4 component B
MSGSLVPLLVLAFPLALAPLAALPAVRGRALWLLPLAPLPAFVLALAGGEVAGRTDFLLLGTVLATDGIARPFLGFAALLWALAGLFAAVSMAGDRRVPVFTGFWCLTLAGNLGVFLARDVATFYVAFAAVSLAAYVLVVHEGTERVLRAGRVYLVLTLVGETCLLAGLLIGVAGAPGLLIEDVRAGIAASPLRDLAVALLVVGFGLKAGLMPLHVWLPLAHPAAPVPASAVLSGAIVKAGVFGLIAFLPAGLPGWGGGLMAAGLAGAFLGALLGLAQRDGKAVLAYSTVSQMGLVIALIGAGVAGGNPVPAFGAAALYCVHHGLAKGALFLAVGVAGAAGGRHRAWVLAVTGLAALSVAGLPLTGGAVAKAAMKDAVGVPWAVEAVTLSAVGTALVLGRFLLLLGAKAAGGGAPPAGLAGPWLVLVGAALAVPWVLLPRLSGVEPGYLLGGAVWSGLWPLGVAAVMGALALRVRWPVPAVPEGDVVVWLERGVAALGRAGGRAGAAVAGVVPGWPEGVRVPGPWRLEAALQRWAVAGPLLVALALAVLVGLVVC